MSDSTRVMLRGLTLKSSGLYRCEISAEAPSFASVQGEGRMEVVCKYFFHIYQEIFYLIFTSFNIMCCVSFFFHMWCYYYCLFDMIYKQERIYIAKIIKRVGAFMNIF